MACRQEIITIKRKKRLVVVFYRDKTDDVDTSIRAKDIAMVQGMGLDVDNNNDPSPENIPQPVSHPRTKVEKNYTHEELGWSWSGIDHRKYLNIQDQKPTIKGFVGESVTHLSFVDMFFLLFLRKFLEDILVLETNKYLDKRLTLGEFLRWIGIYIFVVNFVWIQQEKLLVQQRGDQRRCCSIMLP